ncbi:GNAT family N-acetyltransferase [Peribacillus sp. NPDC097675]|uniref:GNAT family N-acetyltransferase n=1 Tax=Peribacillus sp. NPDC097675 TaxID=3390618 RepID=UPI003D07F215
MSIFIEELKKSDAVDLLEFELRNRVFFEETVPARGDEYYIPEIFNKRLDALLEEQLQGISRFYLIKDKEHSIVGRINVVDYEENLKSCHLGYRIGEKHTGKGMASKALALLVESHLDPNIEIIQAKTTTNNIASQKVLEKNGFEKVVTTGEPFAFNGQKANFIYYTWTKEQQ